MPLAYRNWKDDNVARSVSVQSATFQSSPYDKLYVAFAPLFERAHTSLLNEKMDSFKTTRKDIEKSKHLIQHQYPGSSNTSMCAYISSNLLTLGKWYPWRCDDVIEKPYLICEAEIVGRKSKLKLSRKSAECRPKEIYLDSHCYQLVRHNETFKNNCKTDLQQTNESRLLIHLRIFLRLWMMGNIEQIAYRDESNIMCIERQCMFCSHRELQDWVTNNTCVAHEVPFLCIHNMYKVAKIQCRSSDFKCSDGTCILSQYVCDNESDCPDNTDEVACKNVCNNQTDCFDNCPINSCSCNIPYIQSDNRCIPSYRMYPPPPLVEVYTYSQNYTNRCPQSWSKCTNSLFSSCVPNQKVCVFERNLHGDPLYCNNTEHLEHCAEKKQGCPSMFRCPLSYCIPIHMMCDHVADCPYGEDEHDCKYRYCK